ncbi:2443_t:CDS:2 [Dentiscutata erythropus]|uniref:2443_t:CDS:1 n=1 Tax=Dentiscutata erythropus TaxID=1348616 RepID=A0A9N9I2M3_9GLOM|nr:2443_t:CDS:2 [Dentiscutata erythropus]
MSRPVDFVIAGLGNPEEEYATTRHNANAIGLEQGEGAPVFYRRFNLSADVRDIPYTFKYESGSSTVTNSLRIVLMKPLTAMNESGSSIQKVMKNYAVTDSKKLIVVADDLNTQPGILMVQGGGELAAMRGHKGLENIVSVIGTDFVRLGIGRPAENSTPISQWVLSPFTKENREMDLFGYLLQLTTQALENYSIHRDLKQVKKKFARPRKIPNKLTEMNR